MMAALPALQRGAVWKVRQIEELWDSMLREFPVGSFIVSPYDAQRGLQKARHQQEGVPAATHHLLDGQQRATGIALGFADVWQDGFPVDQVRAACWIDLDAPPESRDVEFVLRVQTRAHPWGYGRANPDARLPQQRIRAAIKAFQAANPDYREARAEYIPLPLTWPWDCIAPVPLPILLAALDACGDDTDAAIARAWTRIRTLPMFRSAQSLDALGAEGSADPAIAAARAHLEVCTANLASAFTDPGSQLARRLREVMARARVLLGTRSGYRIPVLHLKLQDWTAYASRRDATDLSVRSAEATDKKDPVELLFVRINSAGTPLAGEELVYSLLKSAWVDAPDFIETLAHKPAGPARIAALCIRLVQARQQSPEGDDTTMARRLAMPATPGVDDFRRLMRSQGGAVFQDALRAYIQEDAAATFDHAWLFLTDGTKPFALPRVVAAEIAQKAPDVFFLLLRWIDRLFALGTNPAALTANQHKRTLGFVTAVAWFAVDKSRAVAALWQQLQRESDGARLRDFFNKRHFRQICRLGDDLESRMIPLLRTEDLDLACKKRITGYKGCQYTISKADSGIWKHWDRDSWLTGPTADEFKGFYTEMLYPERSAGDDREIDVPESARAACRHFIDVLRVCHPILLFAQRTWVARWFPDFDPALPEYMEDKNRPWDYDHIHPQNYLRSEGGNSLKGLPPLIREWHHSIGNLRVWPLEINRADGDSTPDLKFDGADLIERRYRLTGRRDKLDASFLHEDDLALWEQSLPQGVDRWYLKQPDSHDMRRALVSAIVGRFTAIYREWYRTLRLADLQ